MKLFNRSSKSEPPLRLERRLSPRRNTFIEAEIEIGGGRRLPCIIRNVSDTGAKIETPAAGRVPALFVLHVPGHRPQPCRVVWRALREMGVEYRRED